MPDSQVSRNCAAMAAASIPTFGIHVEERLQLFLCNLETARRTTHLDHDLGKNRLIILPGTFPLKVLSNLFGSGNVTESLSKRVTYLRREDRKSIHLIVASWEIGTCSEADQLGPTTRKLVYVLKDLRTTQLAQELVVVDGTLGDLGEYQTSEELGLTSIQLIVATLHRRSDIHGCLCGVGRRDAQPERHVAKDASDDRCDARRNSRPRLPPDNTTINTQVHAWAETTPKVHLVFLPMVRPSEKLDMDTLQHERMYWADLSRIKPAQAPNRATAVKLRDISEGRKH